MGNAKAIFLKPIDSRTAAAFVIENHYSGKAVNNSKLHFGVFLGDKLGGVLSFGTPMDKRKVIGLVSDTKWHDMMELNRMVFTDLLPRNSESRAIAIAMRLIRTHYPNIEWILSYADGTQCGDGTIYRASGFVLTQINPNKTIIMLPWGETIANLVLHDTRRPKRLEVAKRLGIKVGGESSIKPFIDAGCKPLVGYMLRYIYFINKDAKKRLTCPILPFSDIDKRGAGMYKGNTRAQSKDVVAKGVQPLEDGSNPICALHQSNQVQDGQG